MEFNINLDKLQDILAMPWWVIYKYNDQINRLFAQIDYDQTTLIATNEYYSQIFDEKNHVYIKIWTTNSPYAILCEGKVSSDQISDDFFSNDKLLFKWDRKYRPSRLQMGRFLRFLKREIKIKRETKIDLCPGIIIAGKLLKINNKFYEKVELTQEEWEEKYALFLLKNS